MAAIPLLNIVPFVFKGPIPFTFIADVDIQAVETYSFVSSTGPLYGAISNTSSYVLVGELPPGLTLDSITGIISGTIPLAADTKILTEMVDNYPDIYRPSEDVEWPYNESSYDLGNDGNLTQTFEFKIQGINAPPPISEVELSITVVMDWDSLVNAWLLEEDIPQKEATQEEE